MISIAFSNLIIDKLVSLIEKTLNPPISENPFPSDQWSLILIYSILKTNCISSCSTWCTAQNYRWQNGKQYNRKTNSAQSALARRVRQGCFAKFSLNFVKFEENFAKHEIKNFTKLQKQKFHNNPTPTQSAVSYSPSPPVC